jgi:hypothetical protein
VTGLDEEELIRANYFPIAVCGNADDALFLRQRFPAEMFEATTIAVDVGMEADVATAAARTAASHFVVTSDVQRREVLAAMPHARCAVLPFSAEATTSRSLSREARTDIVMLSDNLEGPAAAAAVSDLVRAIVPALLVRQPQARIRLGGGPVAPALLAEAPVELDLLPTTTPIGSVLDRARVVVVPQHWCGPDTVSNVTEARARAIPIVATSAVVNGAGLKDCVDALAVDTPEAFVEQIARVYTDPWLWSSLAGAAERPPAAPVDDDLVRSLALWACGDAVGSTNV